MSLHTSGGDDCINDPKFAWNFVHTSPYIELYLDNSLQHWSPSADGSSDSSSRPYESVVHEPTHSSGNTLNLIISHGLDVSALKVASVSSAVSDHFLITFEVSLACPYFSDTTVFTSRHLNLAITTTLLDKLPSVLAPFATATKSVDSLTNESNSALVSLLDSVAPVSTRTRRPKKSTPWFTEETRDLKQACKKMERAWRKSKLNVFYLAWHDSVLNYKRALNTARTAYFSSLINKNKHNPRFLFNTVAKLTQKPQSVSCAAFHANLWFRPLWREGEESLVSNRQWMWSDLSAHHSLRADLTSS